MNPTLLRDRLQKEMNQLPDEMVEQIAEFTLHLMAQRNLPPLYDDWQQEEWQDFALEQFLKKDDDVEYTIEDAKEVYRP